MSHPYPSLPVASLVMLAALLVSACGSSSSSTTRSSDTSSDNSGTETETEVESSNIALSSEGASVTSSFSGSESFVIDGDTTTTNFWEAGANGDRLTIDFDQSYTVESVTVYHANMASTSYFSFAFSSDGSSFIEVHNVAECTSFHLGSSDYSCGLTGSIDARYFRISILDNAENIDLYEIEIMGM